MEKRNYKTPEIEIINIEVEGVMAWSTNSLSDFGNDSNTTSTKTSVIKSSYSMDDYNWK